MTRLEELVERHGRVRTVEYDPGYGWIARDPATGKELIEEGFRWRTRSVARAVVDDCRVQDRLALKARAAQESTHDR